MLKTILKIKKIICLLALFLTGMGLQAQSGIQKLADKAAFEAAVKNNEKAVVIFAAEWCHYCKDFLPQVENIIKNYQEITFFKIDYDENKNFFISEGIKTVPTVKLYKKGLKTDEMTIVKIAPLQEKLRDFQHP